MTRTCFILDELYPQDRGGIARLMHNIIHHAKSLDPSAELHVLLACEPPAKAPLQAVFEGIATIHYFRPKPKCAARFGAKNLDLTAVFPRQADPATRELRVLDALLHATHTHGTFDHIEIPDHMGLGTSILQAKQAGYGFAHTQITCRIHSTLSVIIEAEPFYHQRNDWLAPRLEMERYALRHADHVVAHLPTIARYNQTHFSFPKAWLEKVETTFPPVIWPEPEAPTAPSSGGDFIFTSRFQPFKRPELFIKAAITLLESGSDYSGTFRLISYGFTPEYIDFLRLSVPARHRTRILIQTNVPAQDRLAAMAEGIIVQPSKYESLCALAYEASSANRPLLLATDCAAFADDPHWKEGENCLFFAPTPESLAETMEQARTWHPSKVVDTTPGAPYFLKPAKNTPTHPPFSNIAQLSGPVSGPKTIARLAKHTKPPHTINLFGYGPQKAPEPSLAYHPFSEGGIAAQQWHDLAQSLQSEAVILHSPNALPTPAFIEDGAKIVRPGMAYSANSLDASTGQIIIYPGKFKTITLAEPRMCPPCIMLHREDLFRMISDDDTDLLPRFITRLAQSDITLAFSPAPRIVEHSPALTPPLQRHLGYEQGPLWQDGFRWIGMATRPSQNTGLLTAQPLALTLKDKTDLNCSAKHAVQFEIKSPRVFALQADQSLENAILSLTAINGSKASKISVSLQQSYGATPLKTALANHKKGQNVRVLLGGQEYAMRWGPIWHSQPLILVASAENPAKLRLANPILTSKA